VGEQPETKQAAMAPGVICLRKLLALTGRSGCSVRVNVAASAQKRRPGSGLSQRAIRKAGGPICSGLQPPRPRIAGTGSAAQS